MEKAHKVRKGMEAEDGVQQKQEACRRRLIVNAGGMILLAFGIMIIVILLATNCEALAAPQAPPVLLTDAAVQRTTEYLQERDYGVALQRAEVMRTRNIAGQRFYEVKLVFPPW